MSCDTGHNRITIRITAHPSEPIVCEACRGLMVRSDRMLQQQSVCMLFVWCLFGLSSAFPVVTRQSTTATHNRQSNHNYSRSQPFLSTPVRNRHKFVWRMAAVDDDNDSPNLQDAFVFKGIVQALQLYQAAFGNLDIAHEFQVPQKPPWPTASHGIYLGRIVFTDPKQTAILNALKLNYVPTVQKAKSKPTNDKEEAVEPYIPTKTKTANVETVKFSSNDDDDDDDDVDEETKTERQKFKEMMQQSKEFTDEEEEDEEIVMEDENEEEYDDSVEMDEDEEDEVEEIALEEEDEEEEEEVALEEVNPTQFNGRAKTGKEVDISTIQVQPVKLPKEFDVDDPSELSANDKRFRNVYIALAIYRQIYGDLYVPQPFVVPKSNPWPEDIWGLRLGARVNAIRSQGTFVNTSARRRELLDQVGFVWTPNREDLGRRPGRRPLSDTDAERPSAASSLETIFGGAVDFGPDYLQSTADGQDPPALTWDLEGARVPEKMGKPTLPTLEESNEYVEERTLEESLTAAAERAVECGVIEEMGNRKRATKGKQEKDIPWFNDDFGDDFVFEDVVEALDTYKNIYGGFSNFTKDCDFVVPTRKELIGFLGDEDDDLSTMSNPFGPGGMASSLYDDKPDSDDDKEEDGSSEDTDASSNMSIAAEIRRLQKEVEQESRRKAPVTALEDDAEKWGEHLAGMSLGHIVRRIRDGSLEVKHIPERKAQLDAIGFDWGDPKYFIDIPFEKTVCACYAYYLIRGDLFVADNFVMPGDDPWPEALAGYEIGKAVLRIRELQNSFEAYHPEKVRLLRMIDFVWFADTLALPLDPNEDEMTPEMILLGGMGHPDYAKMSIDIPMGLPDKLIEDGPFHDIDDDPKLWWKEYHNWDYVKDYWYQQGRRDNGYVLRKMGYAKMADEHEAKYGPGLFTHIESVLADIQDRSMESRSLEERYDLLRTLNGFRREMVACTDISVRQRDELLVQFESEMYKIIQENAPDPNLQEELENSGFYEAVEENRKKQEAAQKAAAKLEAALQEEEAALVAADAVNESRIDPQDGEDDDLVVEEEIDLDDELGL